jgi:hypothetical protein
MGYLAVVDNDGYDMMDMDMDMDWGIWSTVALNKCNHKSNTIYFKHYTKIEEIHRCNQNNSIDPLKQIEQPT